MLKSTLDHISLAIQFDDWLLMVNLEQPIKFALICNVLWLFVINLPLMPLV